MKKYLESIKSFSIIIICFIVAVLCVKCFELFTSDSLSISHIIEMIYSNLIASLALSFVVFIIFNIISIFSKKAALYTSSVLFSIIIIFEIGLIFYHDTTGLLMGRELIERPLWETVVTVKSVLNFWLIAATILFIVGFTFISMRIVNRQQTTDNRPWDKTDQRQIALLILMIFSIPLFFILNPNQNVNSVNKIWYCLNYCFVD